MTLGAITGAIAGAYYQCQLIWPNRKLNEFIIGFKNEQKRLNPVQMTKFLELYDIPCVPIFDTALILPETCDEMLKIAGGPSAIDGEMREGLVMRSYGGEKSFKAVDSNYLIKYHQ